MSSLLLLLNGNAVPLIFGHCLLSRLDLYRFLSFHMMYNKILVYIVTYFGENSCAEFSLFRLRQLRGNFLVIEEV